MNWDALSALWDDFFWGSSQSAAQSRAKITQPIKSRSSIMYQFLAGNIIRLDWAVNDATDWLDPDDVQLILKPPTGSNETLTPDRISAGHYQVEWSTEGKAAGTWLFRWSGDGVAEEGSFEVKASQLGG